MTDNARLLNLVEVATRLRLSPHTIRKFVKDGKLQPVRICRRLLFHPNEIARLVSGANMSPENLEVTRETSLG
jgi:predicted site-specific integrase-resolvase